MPVHLDDFLDVVERELAADRRRLARLLDRVEALAALHAHAVSVSIELQRAISADDVFSAPRSERERAELQALADRITSDPGGHPAFDSDDGAGHHLETAEGP